MSELSKDQKIAQIATLFEYLEPEDLDKVYKSFIGKFEKESASSPEAKYVKKQLEAIANGEGISAGDNLIISMAWQMFAANKDVQDLTHFDELTREFIANHAVASLKKAKCFLEIAKEFIERES